MRKRKRARESGESYPRNPCPWQWSPVAALAGTSVVDLAVRLRHPKTRSGQRRMHRHCGVSGVAGQDNNTWLTTEDVHVSVRYTARAHQTSLFARAQSMPMCILYSRTPSSPITPCHRHLPGLRAVALIKGLRLSSVVGFTPCSPQIICIWRPWLKSSFAPASCSLQHSASVYTATLPSAHG